MSIAAAPSIQPGQRARITRSQMVTARQHRDAGTGRHGAIENKIGQRSARMARNHDVGGTDLDILERSGDRRQASG